MVDNTKYGEKVLASREEDVEMFVPGDERLTGMLQKKPGSLLEPEMIKRAAELRAIAGESEEFTEASEPFVDYPPEKRVLHKNQIIANSTMSAALSEDRSYESAEAVRAELEQDGESATLSRIKQFIAQDEDLIRQETISQMLSDPNISAEETQQALMGYVSMRGGEIDLQEEFQTTIAISDSSETEEEASVQDSIVNNLEKITLYREQKNKAVNAQVATWDDSTGGALVDFAGILVPFMEQENVADFKKALGMDTSVLEWFFTGVQKEQIRDALIRMPEDKRIEATKKLVQAIDKESGVWLHDNDMAKMYYLEDLLEEGGYPDWMFWVDNLVGVLDVVGLGAGMKRLARTYKISSSISPNSPVGIASIANPREASNMMADALSDESGRVAEAIGATKEDIVGSVMPKPVGADLEGAPDAVIKRMERLDAQADDLSGRTGAQNLVYKDAEVEASRDEAWKYLEGITGMTFRLGMSNYASSGTKYLAKGETGFDINAIYGANEVSGWKTLHGAKNAATKSLGKEQPVEFFVRDPSTNKLFNVKTEAAKAVEDGDYYVQFNYTHTYDPKLVSSFGADAVTRLGSFPVIGKYMQDAVSRFDGWIKNGALVYSDQAAGVEKQAMSLVEKELLNLPRDSKLKVLDAIEIGSKEEKNWSYVELKARFGMDEDEALGYLSFRRTQDLLWELQNKEMYKDLRTKGLDSLYIGGKNTGLFAKKIDESEAKRIQDGGPSVVIYDPQNHKSLSISREDLAKHYAKGGSVARLNQPVYVGHNKYSYVLTDLSPYKGGATTLKPTSRTPLAYKQGYYQRFYDEHYFIKKIYNNGKVDGKAVEGGTEETVAAAGSVTDAEDLINTLRSETADDTIRFEWRRGRELDDSSRESADWDLLASKGLLSARRRGEALKGVEELAKVQDPLQSLVRGARAVSRKVALGGWLDVTKQRWVKSFPEVAVDGLFPKSVEAIRDAAKGSPISNKNLNEAIAIFEYVKMMENVPSKLSKKWQGLALDIAESLEKAPALAKGARAIAQGNPIKTIKTSAYAAFIALNPLRQFPMQASQLMQTIAIDPTYLLSGRMTKDVGALALGMGGMNKMGAKLMGVSEKEYNAIFKNFRDSGMPHSIDQNLFIEGVVTKADEQLSHRSLASRAAAVPYQVGKGAYDAAKRVGFDAGEWTNIAGHWLVAYRRWLKNNPGGDIKSQRAIDEIGLDARQLSYAMNRGGKVGYQGYPTSAFSELMSVPLQFFSVPHKAIMSMTSSKALTKQEKWKLASLNLALFGGAGLGFVAFNDMLDGARDAWGIEMPEDAWVIAKGGFIDYALSAAINHTIEEDPSGVKDTFKFAENLAPTGGGLTPLANILEGFFNKPIAEAVAGASGNVASRIWKAAQQTSVIMQKTDWSTPEKLSAGMETLAMVTGGWSNYYKAKFALKTGMMVSSTGQQNVEVSRAGAIMKLFGIQTAREEAYYSTIMKQADMNKALKEDAKKLYESLRALHSREMSDDNFELELAMYRHVWNIYDDPQEIAIITRELKKQLEFDRDANGTNLAYDIAKRAIGGGDIGERAFNSIEGNAVISEEDKQKIRDMRRVLTGVEAD